MRMWLTSKEPSGDLHQLLDQTGEEIATCQALPERFGSIETELKPAIHHAQTIITFAV